MRYLNLIVVIWAAWIFYLAVMNLKRVRDGKGLSVAAKILGYPVLYVGLVLDFFVNISVCSVLFFEFPRETLVTARLQRHADGGYTWRKSLALWIGAALLNDFDPSGNHLD